MDPDEEPLGHGPDRPRIHEPRRLRRMGERDLRELATKSVEDILTRLTMDKGGLKELLKDIALSDEKIYLLLSLFYKCLVPDNIQRHRTPIGVLVDELLHHESNFLRVTLYQFLLPYLPKNKPEEENRAVLGGVLAIVDTVLILTPRFAVREVVHYRTLLPDKLRDFPDDRLRATLERVERIFHRELDEAKGRQQQEPGGEGGRHGAARGFALAADEERPREGFRELPLIPSQRDLTEDRHLVVRKNRLDRGYDNLEDYLDVQFRLLRADFIIPLRESIDKYLGAHTAEGPRVVAGGEGRNLRVYRDVHVLRPVCADRDLAYRLSFDVSRLGGVNWHKTQRLKFGSLLCLSEDNFQTFLWATVHDHDAALLANGLVDVVFVPDGPDGQDLHHQASDIGRDRRFVMVESPAYFEAYRHVLQGLKNLNDNNFPFARYIVRCQTDVQPPRYLQRQGGRVKYDFTPLIDDDFKIRGAGGNDSDDDDDENRVAAGQQAVDVMTGENWPTAEDLRLDDSQYKALHTALTNEMAVIQGPPGTGKTYLGLKIMKMLLHNQQAWNTDDRRPVLVVCYTNHALDQFLEGILDFFQAPASALVRVGARSTSARLKEMSLNNHRTRARVNRKVPSDTHEAKVRALDQLRNLRVEIHLNAALLELLEQEVITEDCLKSFISNEHMQGLKASLGRRGEGFGILKWLKLDKLKERLAYQAQHKLKNVPPPSALQNLRPSRGSSSSTSTAGLRRGFDPDFADEDEDFDDDDDDELRLEDLLASRAFQDSSSARRLDADDEDDLDDDFYNLDVDEPEVEETEGERLKRRLREVEQRSERLRDEIVALNVSDLNADLPEVSDLTVQVPTKAQNQSVREELKTLLLKHKRLLQGMLRSVDVMSEEEVERAPEVWKLSMKDRWRLYRRWADLYIRQLRGEIREKEKTYFDRTKLYRFVLDQEDRNILEQATVVGMTTTGAARYQSVLFAIAPRVIVVEEAAEVFEAHVVATLSSQCQHLILIGDHKQLRPNPTVYDLAKKCQLDISLFERLILNHFPMECLQYQHRMRPEISAMMRLPELYPQLRDHKVVLRMPQIRGVVSSVFYVSHYHPEERDEETKSCSNLHEAEFLVALCDYLLKQGYRGSQITFLTPYSGQVHAIMDALRKRKLTKEVEGLRVSSVDNYQGEENDIVLLSLVRSNSDHDIGFLKLDNRICVALSRAKMGLYVIGNFDALKNGSDLLDKVVTKAAQQGVFSNGLPLRCPIHNKGVGILATIASDFNKAPEGGCDEPCDFRLTCGHRCLRTCHPSDDHDDYLCPLTCVRVCAQCGQACGGRDRLVGDDAEEEEDEEEEEEEEDRGPIHACCEHVQCERMTEKVIPRCGHPQLMPCGSDPMRATCTTRCHLQLPCGHQCQTTCGKPCTADCQTPVTVDNPHCKHSYQAPCSQRDTAPCPQPCGEKLICDHVCSGTCGECRHGRLHMKCQKRCQKILVCGHDCPSSCCQCPPCPRPCENRCSHSRCHGTCGAACTPCTMHCDWKCPHHKCTKLCWEQCNRQPCGQPCPKLLPECKHPCVGLCGEACPSVCRICTPEKLDDPIFGPPEDDDRFVLLEDCGHVMEVTSLDRWVRSSMGQEDGVRADSAREGAEVGEGSAAGGGREEEERVTDRLVKLPECPQCKTPIRRNLRYGNYVKKVLVELEEIKKRCRGDPAKVDALVRKVDQAKGNLPHDLRLRVQESLFSQRDVPCESRLATQFYQISFLNDAHKLLAQVTSAMTRWPDLSATYRQVQRDLEHLTDWTLQPRNLMSQQELLDAGQELRRLGTLLHLMHCLHSVGEDKIEVEPRLMRRLAICVRQLQVVGPVSDRDLDEGKELRQDLKDLVPDPYTALSDKEREAIVKAVALPTGSWYACPKGHYYVIGECGRPTEVATCPECHSPIGGEDHALVNRNRQAPEFDNAPGPRWSVEDDYEYAMRLQQEEFINWH